MKKSKSHSHKVPRMKTYDQKMKGKGGRPAILSCQSPVPKEPFAITMQKALKSNHLDAVDPRVNLISPESEQ